jgi:hypothetical protein
MRTTDAMRVIHDETAFPGRPCAIREGGWVDTSPPRPLTDALPDLTDPATLGCLLALVREAWSDSQMYVAGRGLWDVFTSHDVEIVQDRYTEAEALVAALEAAP